MDRLESLLSHAVVNIAAAALLAAAVGSAWSVILYYIRERVRSRRSVSPYKYLAAVQRSLQAPAEFEGRLPSAVVPPSETDTLIERVERQIAQRIAAESGLAAEQIKQEMGKELTEFRARIANIERRFPEDAELERIASINDALLAKSIEELGKKVESIEERVLSRWDVAIVVSVMITGISFVVGATVAVIRFFSPR